MIAYYWKNRIESLYFNIFYFSLAPYSNDLCSSSISLCCGVVVVFFVFFSTGLCLYLVLLAAFFSLKSPFKTLEGQTSAGVTLHRSPSSRKLYIHSLTHLVHRHHCTVCIPSSVYTQYKRTGCCYKWGLLCFLEEVKIHQSRWNHWHFHPLPSTWCLCYSTLDILTMSKIAFRMQLLTQSLLYFWRGRARSSAKFSVE